MPDSLEAEKRKAYWSATLRLTSGLLLVWFLVSFGCGILWRETLDKVSIGGAPLGFWFAQQGSVYVFVALIFIYCRAMSKIERDLGMEKD